MRRVGHLYQRWSDKGIKTKKGDERGSMKEKKSQEEVDSTIGQLLLADNLDKVQIPTTRREEK